MIDGIKNYFSNYEFDKLDFVKPELVSLLIFALFVLSILLTLRKKEGFSEYCLEPSYTEQLKGLAIFFVIAGHLWVHVAKVSPSIVLSGDGVAMFLLLSGFGLAVSWNASNPPSFAEFFKKRLKRLMVPYWVATIIILLLDSVLLNRHLPIDGIVLTVIGLNIRQDLAHLDYARWFITFILLWYILFYFAKKYFDNVKYVFALFVFSAVLLPMSYYFLKVGWYQFIAFTVGCSFAFWKEEINCCLKKYINFFQKLSVIVFISIIIYKIIYNNQYINKIIVNAVPNIFLLFLNDIVSVVFIVSIIILSIKFFNKGYESGALSFMGKYSYELFLFHGVFLIKYNPVIKSTDVFSAVFEFLIFFIFISFFSLIFSKIVNIFYGKKVCN